MLKLDQNAQIMWAQTGPGLYLDSLITPVFRKDCEPRYLNGRACKSSVAEKRHESRPQVPKAGTFVYPSSGPALLLVQPAQMLLWA